MEYLKETVDNQSQSVGGVRPNKPHHNFSGLVKMLEQAKDKEEVKLADRSDLFRLLAFLNDHHLPDYNDVSKS